jgi:Family of unknown function (DUF6186)
MTDRTLVILGFAVIFAGTAAAIITSYVRPDRLAKVSETLDRLTRTRTAKIIAVLIWAWLGWHFLAR